LGFSVNANGRTVLQPTTGTAVVRGTRVSGNPIDVNESTFVLGVSLAFPVAAQQIGGLFGQLELPEFQGLQLSAVAARYNESCTGVFLNLD
jgi:hypothetical protein